MDRISTASIHRTTVNDIARVQADLATAQRAIASGQRVNSFNDLSSNINRVQDLQVSISATISYRNINDVAIARMNVMVGALDQMIEIGRKLKENLVTENSPGGTVFNLAEYSRSSLDSIESALNIQQAGRSLFAGSKTDQKAVGTLRNISNMVADQPTASYYLGDSFIANVQASDTQNIDYGITAGDPAIQSFIGAFHKAIDLDETRSIADQLLTSDLLEEGMQGLIDLRAKLGLNLKATQESNEQHVLVHTQLNAAYTKIMDNSEESLVAGTIEAGLMEATLTATMQVFARVSQLSLSDFLR